MTGCLNMKVKRKKNRPRNLMWALEDLQLPEEHLLIGFLQFRDWSKSLLHDFEIDNRRRKRDWLNWKLIQRARQKFLLEKQRLSQKEKRTCLMSLPPMAQCLHLLVEQSQGEDRNNPPLLFLASN